MHAHLPPTHKPHPVPRKKCKKSPYKRVHCTHPATKGAARKSPVAGLDPILPRPPNPDKQSLRRLCTQPLRLPSRSEQGGARCIMPDRFNQIVSPSWPKTGLGEVRPLCSSQFHAAINLEMGAYRLGQVQLDCMTRNGFEVPPRSRLTDFSFPP